MFGSGMSSEISMKEHGQAALGSRKVTPRVSMSRDEAVVRTEFAGKRPGACFFDVSGGTQSR